MSPVDYQRPKPLIDCDYLSLPPFLDTDIEQCAKCNAVYSAAPDPQAGKPCRKGLAYFDKFNNICRIPKVKR